jgi:hypothetical protein
MVVCWYRWFGLVNKTMEKISYSAEQLRRKAHLENGGTLANYDRTHYTNQE